MTFSGRNQLRVRCERLLLVEGRDECNLFEALKGRCLGDSAAEVQVVEAGGHTRFQARIHAILQMRLHAGSRCAPWASCATQTQMVPQRGTASVTP